MTKLYDMQLYICPKPNGTAVHLSSQEDCQCKYDSQGYGRQFKNENWEEIWADDKYVYRGMDVSSYRLGEVYDLWTASPAGGPDIYGSPWIPRWFNKEMGSWKRSPIVKHRRAETGEVFNLGAVVTYIRMVEHHDSYKFQSGKILSNVIELQYSYPGPGGGVPNWDHVLEHYFYAEGIGLVGFHDDHMWTFATDEKPRPLKPPIVITWFQRPAVPPVQGGVPTVPLDTFPAGIDPFKALVLPADGVRVRKVPGTASNNLPLFIVTKGQEVTLYKEPLVPNVNGHDWQRLEVVGGSGFAAVKRLSDGVLFFDPIGAPVPDVKIKLARPLPGSVISARFNQVRDYGKHEGMDFALAPNPCAIGGVQVLACADGEVESVRDFVAAKAANSLVTGYGLYVKIKHVTEGHEYITWYCHLSAALVCKGDKVKRGDPIGILGTSGNSTGYHLHLNLQDLGRGLSGYVVADVVDPELYLITP